MAFSVWVDGDTYNWGNMGGGHVKGDREVEVNFVHAWDEYVICRWAYLDFWFMFQVDGEFVAGEIDKK